jgi:hypothetical protein
MTGAGFLPVWNAMMLPSTVPLVRLEHATTRSSPRLVALAAGAVMWAL